MRNFIAATVASAMMPIAAYAADLAPGEYLAADYNDIRSVMSTNDSLIASKSGLSRQWSVGPTGFFDFDGTNATLTGSLTNTGSTGGTLAFNFLLELSINEANVAHCRYRICSAADTSMWSLFDLDNGSFTGMDGTDMAGLTYDVTQYGDHGAQAGIGGNNLDAGDLGFSMGFAFTRTDSTDTSDRGVRFYDSGFGTFNMDLFALTSIDQFDFDPQDEGPIGAQVPLPAAGWMLLAGLGGMAAMRRRRKPV